MLINLSELFSVEGAEKTYSAAVEMTAYRDASGCEYPVTAASPAELAIKNLGKKTFGISIKAKIILSIPCSRCLAPSDHSFDVDSYIEADLKQTEQERIDQMDDQPYINGYNLDVDMLLANELLLMMPMVFLCKTDCRGLCSRCGKNLNMGSCDCVQDTPDLRMSVIQDIFKQHKEV